MNSPSWLVVGMLLAAAAGSSAQTTAVECAVDFKAFNAGELRVKIQANGSGELASSVNGRLFSVNTKVTEYTIKPGLDFSLDPYSPAFEALSFGEKALFHIHAMREIPKFKAVSTLSFDLAAVRTLRVYDIEGNAETNKFGGTVLMEGLDAKGVLLGRMFRSVFVNACL